jgi:hypothetical protein
MKLPICLEKEALPVYIEQGVWRQELKWLSKWYKRIFYFPIISVAVLNCILTKVSKFKLAWYLISSQIKQDWKCVICTKFWMLLAEIKKVSYHAYMTQSLPSVSSISIVLHCMQCKKT